jgi:hypothetical protein
MTMPMFSCTNIDSELDGGVRWPKHERPESLQASAMEQTREQIITTPLQHIVYQVLPLQRPRRQTAYGLFPRESSAFGGSSSSDLHLRERLFSRLGCADTNL